MHRFTRSLAARGSRRYSSHTGQQEPSPYAQWYASIFPAMVPIAILGSAVYMGLNLLQMRLAHEKYMDNAHVRVQALEAEIDELRRKREALNTSQETPVSDPSVTNNKSTSWWPRW